MKSSKSRNKFICLELLFLIRGHPANTYKSCPINILLFIGSKVFNPPEADMFDNFRGYHYFTKYIGQSTLKRCQPPMRDLSEGQSIKIIEAQQKPAELIHEEGTSQK